VKSVLWTVTGWEAAEGWRFLRGGRVRWQHSKTNRDARRGEAKHGAHTVICSSSMHVKWYLRQDG
jgi:hypothetical protein